MFIYKTTNLINGIIYVGKCSREKYVDNYLGSGTFLRRAIKKYGIENFFREIIEDNISDITILNEREMFWISYYNSRDINIGYNLSAGGEGAFGYHHTEESRDKMKESRKNVEITEEWKENMRKNSWVNRGAENPGRKKPYTQEERLEQSNRSKGWGSSCFCRAVPNTSSEYIGVTKKKKRWRCRIRLLDQTTFEIGTFSTEIEAALAYNEIAQELYGWRARLNVISEEKILELWKE